MTSPDPKNKTDHKGFLFDDLPLETETSFFILVNALDVFMTFLLLNHGPEFQESNGIARYFLDRFGFPGMIGFKFVLVAFVALITQWIARSHLKTARAVLIAGIVIVSAVVVYSGMLWIKFTGYFG